MNNSALKLQGSFLQRCSENDCKALVATSTLRSRKPSNSVPTFPKEECSSGNLRATFLFRDVISVFFRILGAEGHRAFAVGTKIIADPEKYFQELISEKWLILLRDGPCLELIVVFQ